MSASRPQIDMSENAHFVYFDQQCSRNNLNWNLEEAAWKAGNIEVRLGPISTAAGEDSAADIANNVSLAAS